MCALEGFFMSQAQAIAAAAVKPMISQVLISMVEETIWVNLCSWVSSSSIGSQKISPLP